jgi:hypothetical protein
MANMLEGGGKTPILSPAQVATVLEVFSLCMPP